MKISEFNAALYYAVREDFNGKIDRSHDGLIRRAIAYVVQDTARGDARPCTVRQRK